MLNDTSWVRRRVETIEFLDENRTEHRVTLDIDTDLLLHRATKFKLDIQAPAPIPLENLKKELQLDLDLRDRSGASLPVTLSDEDSHTAHSLVLATLMRHKVAYRSIPATVRAQLFEIVRQPSIDLLLEIANQIVLPVPATGDELVKLSVDDVACWRRFLAVGEIFEHLARTAQNYLLSTEIPLGQGVVLVKFRYVELADRSARPFWRQRLGFGAPSIFLPVSGIGTAHREHTRVLAPSGSVITSARLRRNDQEVALRDYGLRESAERAVIYTRDRPRGSYGAVVTFIPTIGTFYVPALLSILFLWALVGLGGSLELADWRFSKSPANADAAVAILALIPSLLSVYLVRQGEHRFVSQLLWLPRGLVLLAAASAVLIAAGVAADVQHGSLVLLFVVGFAANSVTVLYLSTAAIVTQARASRKPLSTFPLG